MNHSAVVVAMCFHSYIRTVSAGDQFAVALVVLVIEKIFHVFFFSYTKTSIYVIAIQLTTDSKKKKERKEKKNHNDFEVRFTPT